MSEKTIPVFANTEGEHQVQVGWASEEVDGGHAIDLDDKYAHSYLTNVWYGEPDPNPQVTAQANAEAQEAANAQAAAEAAESEAEVHDQPEPTDSAPIEVPVTEPPVVEETPEESANVD